MAGGGRRAGRTWSLRRAVIGLILGSLLGILPWLAATAEAVGTCALTVGPWPLPADPSDAIEIPWNGRVLVQATSSVVVSRVEVALAFGPLSWPIGGSSAARAREWHDFVSVEPYAAFGVGLYEIAGRADGGAAGTCQVRGWIRLTGRQPWETPIGWVAIAIIVTGLLQALRTVLSAARGRGSLGRAIASGVITGIGLLLFAQQAGVEGLTVKSVVVWTVLPGAIGALTHSVLGFAGWTSTWRPAPTPASPGTRPAEPARPTAASRPRPGAEPTATGGSTSAPSPPAQPPPGTRPRPGLERPAGAAIPSPVGAATGAGPVAAGQTAGGGLTAGGAAVVGAADDRRDPPRTAFARVESPNAVVAEEEFELVVGLSGAPDEAVIAQPIRRPRSSVGPYRMTIQVIAEAFRLSRPGESWRVDLPVTAAEPYPTATIHLTPAEQAEAVRVATIRVMYSIDGHPVGLANRPVAVVRSAALLATAPAPPPAPPVDVSLPTGDVAPDLTVRIERAESEASGELLVQLLAADQSVAVPPAPMRIDIGGDPAADLRRVIQEMNAVEGRPTQFVSLRGVGLTIAEQLPQPFWDVLRAVAAKLDRPPMILFLSAEPYVPWELAIVDPPLDPTAPPFLSAQANVGRWILGQRRPKLPPPSSLSVSSLAVVSGVYELPGWERLLEAEGEAADLVGTYGATAVNATAREVVDLLRGNPTAELIHFAVHGNFDREGLDDGLILVDGLALDPLAVRGTPIAGTPFIFLNACQVGRGNTVLGDAAGMAEAFLFAGAAGVIAPLWSIDDRIARQVAIHFYERALRGDTAADILRTERAAFRDAPETVSSTWIAYQYFGHPALRLQRTTAATAGGATGGGATAGGATAGGAAPPA